MKFLRNLILILLAIVIIAVTGLRLYFNNTRLRVLAERQLSALTHTEIRINRLRFSLWNGVEASNIHLHAARDDLQIRRLALHWRWTLSPQIILPEFAIEGIEATIDQQGKLVDLLQSSQKESEAPFNPKQFVMPIAVEVQKINVSIDKVMFLDKPNHISLTHAHLTGTFFGKEKQIKANLLFRIGDPQQFATVKIHKDNVDLILQSNLKTEIHSTQLADLNLSVDSQIQLNNRPLFALRASMRDVFSKRLIDIQKLHTSLNFKDLTPLLEFFAPDIHLQGQLEANLAPFSATTEDIAQQSFLLHLQTHALGIQGSGFRMKNIQATCDLKIKQPHHIQIKQMVVDIDHKVILDMQGSVEHAQSPNLHFNHVAVSAKIPSIPRALTLVVSKHWPFQLSGSLSANAELHGNIPYQELTQILDFPQEQDLSLRLDASSRVIHTLLQQFRRGLPFTSHITIDVKNLTYNDIQTQIRHLNARSALDLEPHQAQLHLESVIDKTNVPMIGTNARTTIQWAITPEGFDFALNHTAGEIEISDLALQNVQFQTIAHYVPGGDLKIEKLYADLPSAGFSLTATGSLLKPLRAFTTQAWKQSDLPGIEATLALHTMVDLKKAPLDLTASGTAQCDAQLQVRNASANVTGTIAFDGISATSQNGKILNLQGSLPFDLIFLLGQSEKSVLLTKYFPLGDGNLSLITYDQDIRQHPIRSTFYDVVRRYQQPPHLAAEEIRVGPYQVNNLELDARLVQGMLNIDHFRMQFLGGDVVGSFGLQIANNGSVRSFMNGEVSNLDASYFERLHLIPGPGSELNADIHFAFLVGPHARDIDLNMNVTRLGTQTLDRLLQLLDPEEQDPKLQEKRQQLKLVTISRASAWIRYENLNIDLDTLPIWHIPYTSVGFPNIDRALIRRYALSDQLNIIMQPYQKKLAVLLGW